MKTNPSDFQEIYRQYKLLVYNLALHYLQHIEDAEEITQDVFVKIYHSHSSFDGKSSLKTWIYRITINKCLDSIRMKSSRKNSFVYGKVQNDTAASNSADYAHPGILMENREQAALLFKVIDRLPDNQRTAFILSKIEGLGNSEIADIMKLSVSAIESLLFRAKATLREKLAVLFEEYRRK